MKQKKILWQLYQAYAIIIVLALLTVSLFLSRIARDFYYEQISIGLESRAQLLTATFGELISNGKFEEIDQQCKDLGQKAKVRVTVVTSLGDVIGDSDEDISNMDNHRQRAELREALRGRTGNSIRPSPTLDLQMVYVAVPIMQGNEVLGAIRTAIPTVAIKTILNRVYYQIVLTGLLILLIATLTSLIISKRFARPLEEMKLGALRFARGEFDQKIQITYSEEFASVGQAMNKMAEQLDERINTILRQTKEQQAILKSMVEGVLAIDTDERLIHMNEAARKMLHITSNDREGTTIPEIIRNVDLQRFVQRTLVSNEAVEGQITIHEENVQFFQAHGTTLFDAQNRKRGAVVVLNDITRIKELENLRKDFVANVSHELKTPVTSIKGFVDTLLDGAYENPEACKRFLGIMAKQVERLDNIIEDLLLLSRIEHSTNRRDMDIAHYEICTVFSNTIELCQLLADEKRITLINNCPPDKTMIMNPDLIEQALINLVDNAIKYSDEGNKVVLDAETDGNEIVLAVSDSGRGIAREHLPRLFERFYRIDKARSRKAGGTGLGLAIVKHIAQAHGGRVSVVSTVGEGSTFFIHLPMTDK